MVFLTQLCYNARMIAERRKVIGQSAVETREAIAAPPEQTWAVLGMLRFAMAFVVFASHSSGYLSGWLSNGPMLGPYGAVLVFFAVSGYSIAHSLRNGSAGFYQRRIDRIYPLYFFSLVLGALPFLFWGPAIVHGNFFLEAPATPWSYVAQFFFLQGILTPHFPTAGPTWSLAIEAVYYAAAPLLIRLSERWILALAGLSALCYCFHDSLGAATFIDPHDHAPFVFLLWAWLGGFWFYRHRDQRRAQLALMFVGVGMIGVYDQTPERFTSLTCMLGAFLLSQAHAMPWLSPKMQRLGNWLGNISYPLYICHEVFYCLLIPALPSVPGWIISLLVLVCVVLAYHLIDAPYQRYARRRYARPALLVSAA